MSAGRKRWAGAALSALTFVASLLTLAPSYAQQPKSAASPQPTGAKSSAAPAGQQAGAQQPPKAAPQPPFDIDQYRIDGAETLPQIEIEEAVYPFLGPKRTAEDVEKARTALEKAYHDRGYQTVAVSIPQQNVQSRVVVLKVTELKVGQLRVKNSRYFDLDSIKGKAASLKEGTVPNFGEVTKDIVALNQQPDRRVTPALRAGVTPGTVDVDLNVEDKPPVHANVELNNRQSPNTTPLRANATVHYDNLWQLGHSLSFSYQVAPQRRQDAEVYSSSYLARLPDNDFLSFLVYGVKSKSDVATIGGMNVVGPGEILGGRAVMTLPTRGNFFHTLSFGLDYKHFDQTVNLGTDAFSSPITYYPVVVSYGANWQGDSFLTQLNVGLTHGLRGIGSEPADWDVKRYKATANFIVLKADLSHTQELPESFQLFGKVQGQIADQPLVSSEQFSVGGLDTVRGYFESETLGDNGIVGTAELRTPNIGSWLQQATKDETGQGASRFTVFNELRLFTFADAGRTTINNPLPEQQSKFNSWSYGFGTRFKFFDYVNGMVVYSVPMLSQTYTEAKDHRVNFRLWGEF